MSIVIPEGFSNVSLLFTCLGSVKTKVTSFGCLGDPLTNPDAATIATTMYNIFVGSGRPCNAANMGNDYVFQGTSVTKTVGGLPVIGQHLAPLTGTSSFTSPSSNVALLVKKVTAAGGRKNRGRLFVPPASCPEAGIDSSGFMSVSAQGVIQAQWTSALTAMGTALDLPYLLHSDATAPTPITGFSVEIQVATQRRRLR